MTRTQAQGQLQVRWSNGQLPQDSLDSKAGKMFMQFKMPISPLYIILRYLSFNALPKGISVSIQR